MRGSISVAFPESTCQRFELSFGDVVWIPSVKNSDVETDSSIHRQTFKDVAVHDGVIGGAFIGKR